MKLNLKNPIIFFDLETTGLDIAKDRIVELCYIRVEPNGNEEAKSMRINPEIHIPEEASKVHGIYDEDVKECPTFKQIAKTLWHTFEGCDCIMAGHIHKRQVIKRGDVEIVYPGSLIQQSFGETVSEHGFAVWEIDENGKFGYKFVDIENDYSLYDMEVESLEALYDNKEKLINM